MKWAAIHDDLRPRHMSTTPNHGTLRGRDRPVYFHDSPHTNGQAMTAHQSGENSADQADASHTSSSGGGSADGADSHSGGNVQSHD